MPAGDWHPDSRIMHEVVQIQLTTDGEVHHVGASYLMRSPNGTPLANKAFSWPIPTETRKRLEAIMAELNDAVVAHEGVAGIDFREFAGPMPERTLVEELEANSER